MKKQALALAISTVLMSGAASAATINAGGILIDPGFHFEVASVYENPVFAVGQELKGYGEVSQINGSANFCASGAGTCELTYRFGGFLANAVSATAISFTGGWVNFYVGHAATNDFNPFTSGSSAADITAATNGSLWLSLAGHAFDASGTTLAATGVNIGTGSDSGTGSGNLDVDWTGTANGNTAGAGASANFNLDTNSVGILFDGSMADFLLTSSFNPKFPIHASECRSGTLTSCLSGSADLRGMAVPEPSTVALLGLGLVGAGIASSRRRKASA